MSHEYTYPEFSQTGLPADPLVEKAFDFALSKLKTEMLSAEKDLLAKEAHVTAHIAEVEASKEETIAAQIPEIKQQLIASGRTDVTDEMLKAALERRVDQHIEQHREELQAELSDTRQFNQDMISNLANRALFLLNNCENTPSNELLAASLVGYSIGTISSFWDAQEALGSENKGIFKTIADFTGILTGQKNPFEVSADSVRLLSFTQKLFLEQRLDMAKKFGPEQGEQAAMLAQLMGGGGVPTLDDQQALHIYQGILAINRVEPKIAAKLVDTFNELSAASKTNFRIENDGNGGLKFTSASPEASSTLGNSFDDAAEKPVKVEVTSDEAKNKGSAKDWLRRKKGGPGNG